MEDSEKRSCSICNESVAPGTLVTSGCAHDFCASCVCYRLGESGECAECSTPLVNIHTKVETHCVCQFRKTRVHLPLQGDQDVTTAIVKAFKIPRKKLKIVARGKVMNEIDVAATYKEDSKTVFYIVGVPLSKEELEKKKAEKEAKLRKEKKAAEEAIAKEARKKKLEEENRKWAAEEAERLQREEEAYRAGRSQGISSPRSNNGVVSTVLQAAIKITNRILELPVLGITLSASTLFVSTLFVPMEVDETEEVMRARMSQLGGAQLRRMGRIGGAAANHTASPGGG